jgi:hypothetical protein
MRRLPVPLAALAVAAVALLIYLALAGRHADAPAGPSGVTTPGAGTPSARGEAQLVYTAIDGTWLVNADVGGRRRLPGPQECHEPAWSPSGRYLLCATLPSLTGRTISVLEPDASRTVRRIESVSGSVAWSPDERQIAYVAVTLNATPAPPAPPDLRTRLVIEDVAGGNRSELDGGQVLWSPDGAALAVVGSRGSYVYSLASKQPQTFEGVPVLWLRLRSGPGLLVDVAPFDPQSSFHTARYVALDLASGVTTALPAMDGSILVKRSPDARFAAFVNRGDAPPGTPFVVGVLDASTLQAKLIPSSSIGYPSEGIPSDHLAWTADSTRLAWADVQLPTARVQSAKADATDFRVDATLPALRVSFASDLSKLTYLALTSEPQLWVANRDGSGATPLGPSIGEVAWRP